MQQLNYIPRGFCRITMVGDDFSSQSRAKDVMIIPVTEPSAAETHQLRFYDCGCGAIRQVTGTVVAADAEKVVFQVGEGKKFVIEKLGRPGG